MRTAKSLSTIDYTVSEVNNAASAVYVIPADKVASVKYNATTIVEMHNVLRDTPKTGDNSNIGLWAAIAGISAVGIAVCGVLGFKKKKRKKVKLNETVDRSYFGRLYHWRLHLLADS